MISAINSTLQSVSRTKIEKPHNVAFKAVLPQQIDNVYRKNKPNVNFTSGWKFIGGSALIGAAGLGGAHFCASLGMAEGAANWIALIGGVAAVLSIGAIIIKAFNNS